MVSFWQLSPFKTLISILGGMLQQFSAMMIQILKSNEWHIASSGHQPHSLSNVFLVLYLGILGQKCWHRCIVASGVTTVRNYMGDRDGTREFEVCGGFRFGRGAAWSKPGDYLYALQVLCWSSSLANKLTIHTIDTVFLTQVCGFESPSGSSAEGNEAG